MTEEFEDFNDFADDFEAKEVPVVASTNNYKGNKKKGKEVPQEVVRVRLPKNKEVLGFVEQLLGLRKMYVRCFDGKTRLCRIPGRLRRRMWVRQGDIVIVEPWEYEENEKGDIIFDYRRNQVEWLRKKGYLKDLEEF